VPAASLHRHGTTMFGSVDWGARPVHTRQAGPRDVRARDRMYLSLLILLRITPNHETGSASLTNLLVIVLLADAALWQVSIDRSRTV
jgi:hypothetical protein